MQTKNRLVIDKALAILGFKKQEVDTYVLLLLPNSNMPGTEIFIYLSVGGGTSRQAPTFTFNIYQGGQFRREVSELPDIQPVICEIVAGHAADKTKRQIRSVLGIA